MKNKKPITSYIKHLAVSGLSSVSARIISSCNLIGNRFEMPNVSYTQPLCVSVKRQPTHKWHIWFLPTHEPTLKKPKEPFFANARTDEPTLKSKFDD